MNFTALAPSPSDKLASASAAFFTCMATIFSSMLPAGDQFVDKHRLILANPMGAIRSLVFRCRVPPRVVMDDSVCGGEVQTYTPGLQTDQEDRYFFVAEPLRAAGCGSTGIGSARPKQRSGGVQPMKRPVVHRL